MGVGSRIISKLRGLKSFEHKFTREYQVFGPEGVRLILRPEVACLSKIFLSKNFLLVDQLSACSPLQRTSVLCLRTYTQNQLLRDTDAVSMANSLEVRVPFLDPELVNFILSLPDNTKLKVDKLLSPYQTYRQTGAKRILIDAVRDLLPSNIDQQAKQGFGLPMANWLRGPLKTILEDTLSPTTINQRGFFIPTQVTYLKNKFLAGKLHWAPIWLLVVIELWCREMLDNPRTTA